MECSESCLFSQVTRVVVDQVARLAAAAGSFGVEE
jgi:hypothetical protein